MPLGDYGSQGRLGGQVVLPRGVVTQSFLLDGGRDFGHDKQAPNDGAGEPVNGAELVMPGVLGLYKRRYAALGNDGATILVAGQGGEVGEAVQGGGRTGRARGSAWVE